MVPPRLETERLWLTWPDAAQIDAYHDAIVGTDMFDTLLWDGPTSRQDLHDYWIARRADAGDACAVFSLAIVDKEAGAYLGGVALRPVHRDPAILDLGYALAPRFHGRGFATEAVRRLVDEGFHSRGAERIFATVFVGNEASRRVCEKVGLRFEGTSRRAVLKRGVWLDEWILAITRPDWDPRA